MESWFANLTFKLEKGFKVRKWGQKIKVVFLKFNTNQCIAANVFWNRAEPGFRKLAKSVIEPSWGFSQVGQNHEIRVLIRAKTSIQTLYILHESYEQGLCKFSKKIDINCLKRQKVFWFSMLLSSIYFKFRPSCSRQLLKSRSSLK